MTAPHTQVARSQMFSADEFAKLEAAMARPVVIGQAEFQAVNDAIHQRRKDDARRARARLIEDVRSWRAEYIHDYNSRLDGPGEASEHCDAAVELADELAAFLAKARKIIARIGDADAVDDDYVASKLADYTAEVVGESLTGDLGRVFSAQVKLGVAP